MPAPWTNDNIEQLPNPTNPNALNYYNPINAMWPDLINQRSLIAPARNGMDRMTGKLLQGWEHVEQSMELIFATAYHERVIRRWVGSFVPIILAETYVPRIITRFFWAMATAIDLQEPNYRIKQVFFMGRAVDDWAPRSGGLDEAQQTSINVRIRTGDAIFRTEGAYRPRAHLGDFSIYEKRQSVLIGRGSELWDVRSS